MGVHDKAERLFNSFIIDVGSLGFYRVAETLAELRGVLDRSYAVSI